MNINISLIDEQNETTKKKKCFFSDEIEMIVKRNVDNNDNNVMRAYELRSIPCVRQI